jgi:hypothetical protein
MHDSRGPKISWNLWENRNGAGYPFWTTTPHTHFFSRSDVLKVDEMMRRMHMHDSRCSKNSWNLTPHRSWFTSYSPHRIPIRIANNAVVYSAGIGSVQFEPRDGDRIVVFHDVLHVPDLTSNLLSTCNSCASVGCVARHCVRMIYALQMIGQRFTWMIVWH